VFKNYLKIAWKVLFRRKFFTFVSLFGISFTLLVLMVAVALIEHMVRPAASGSRLDRTLFVERIHVVNENMDINSSPSYYLLDRYVRTMTNPEAISLHTSNSDVSAYINDRKVSFSIKYTDEVFWDIMQHQFLEGHGYSADLVQNAEHVAVITERTRTQLFGDGPAVGRYVETTAGNFRIIGVIPGEEVRSWFGAADIYAPITTAQWAMTNRELYGSCMALLQARDKGDFGAIKREFSGRLDKIREDYAGEATEINLTMGTQADLLLAHWFGSADDGSVLLAAAEIIIPAILFMLFPAINLVNINISRILERSSEIGVRKAFGASSRTLLGQFITENVFLTLIGGALAYMMTWVVLEILNESGIVPWGHLALNGRVFVAAVFVTLFFGVFSGVLPAYRMSRLHPVEALRGGAA
jgi:putative ABC transport system permease protein